MKLTRVQRKRIKGYKLPPKTVCCTRPGPLGNPFLPSKTTTRFHIVHAFQLWAVACFLQGAAAEKPDGKRFLKAFDELLQRVRNGEVDHLACYCPLGGPCHVDVLIDLLEAKP